MASSLDYHHRYCSCGIKQEINARCYFVGAVLFALLGFGSVIPVFHSVVIDNILAIVSIPAWLPFMAVLYLIGGVLYAVRFPECLMPGTFDVWVLTTELHVNFIIIIIIWF